MRDLVRDRMSIERGQEIYERRLGWKIEVDREAMRITTVSGERKSAITMPEPLGTRVLRALIHSNHPAVVVASGEARWLTFLTQPQPSHAVISDELERARVRTLPRGTPIMLPIPDHSGTDVRWIAPPKPNGELPLWSVIVSLARRYASQAFAWTD